MKNIKLCAIALIASVSVLAGCQRAEAAPLPLDANISYVDNGIIDKEGVGVNLGTEVNNIRFGITTFSTEDRLESYGAYAGVPIRVQGTKLAFVPQVRVERYRDIEETTGGIGIGAEYEITQTLRLEAAALANRGFSDSDVKGEVYSVGLTKTFR